MFQNNKDICLHFIGIGGIGMSGIAHVLLSLGYKVTGSDLSESQNVEKLRSLGAEIYIGHKKENIKKATIVIHTSAVDQNNEELLEAKERKLPIMRRAEMLAELMRLKKGIAIAGTHGKTTTTSLLATIIKESHMDPTYIIGGIVSNLKGHAYVGKGEYIIAEADESDGTFLLLNPMFSVITNIDYDHMEFYKTKENVHNAFEEFINKVPFYGRVAINAHDENILSIIPKIKKPWTTFGIIEELDMPVDIGATEIEHKESSSLFKLVVSGKELGKIEVNIPGRHNILNALGAISIALHLGIDFQLIKQGIEKFNGVGRRFENLYKKENFEVLDDYAHHPTEVKETLKTFKISRPNKRRIAIFEPHRFSRTRDSWDEFVKSFDGVDELYILDIYPASEAPIAGIDSKKLVEEIKKNTSVNATYCPNEEFENLLESLSVQGNSLITLGAGSIGRKIRSWVEAR